MENPGTHSDGPQDVHMGRPPQPSTSATQQSPLPPAPGAQAQAGPSSSGAKRKRSDDEHASESETQSESGPRAKKSRRSNRAGKKKPYDWHMKRNEVPENAERTKAALELHIRTLWCLPDQNSVPPMVTDALRKKYSDRFTSSTQVTQAVTGYLQQHATSINEARRKVEELRRDLPENSIVSNNIKRMKQHDLCFMFATVAAAGLHRWAPDVLSRDPESMYNQLHERIALDTFEHISGNYGYSQVANNLAFVQDRALMCRFYRNFVFGYMLDIAKLEKKSPGAVAEANRMDNVYKRRLELKEGRVDVLRAQGFNGRVIALANETEAHSDDESSDDSKVYTITRKEGRSEKVTKLFRMCDEKRARLAQSKKGGHRTERVREEPEMPKPAQFPALPTKVPIDWFSPTYWNNELTLREQAQIIERNGVNAALPLAEHCGTWAACRSWKTLSEDAFALTWGEPVLEAYTLPTEEELAELVQQGGATDA